MSNILIRARLKIARERLTFTQRTKIDAILRGFAAQLEQAKQSLINRETR